jgi:ferredoxin
VLYGLRGITRLRRVLSGGRLHVLGSDEDNPPFGRIQVDPILCIGCKKCVSKGPDGCFLDGCPWDAIVMLDIAEVEKVVGAMTF